MTVETKLLRLDIGSSHLRVRPDYTTVDLYAPEADVKADMGDLPFEDGSVDEIWASHCLEHVGRERVPAVLREWFRVLAPGRPAIILVPNLDYAARFWLHGDDPAKALDMFFGHQQEPGETHLTGWNPALLREDCLAAGFEVVEMRCIFEGPDNVAGSYWHDMESIQVEVRKP